MNFKIILFIWIGGVFNSAYISGNKEVKKSFKKAHVVFIGELIKKEIKQTNVLAPSINTKQNYIRTLYSFKIIESFKGVIIKDHIEITLKYKGREFVKGEKYLVYSNLSNYLLTSNFYLNGEKVTPFLTIDEKSGTKLQASTPKKEIKKLRKLAKKWNKRQKRKRK